MASIVDTGLATGPAGRRPARVMILWRLLRRMRSRHAAKIALRRELTDPRLRDDVGVPPSQDGDFATMFARELLRSGMGGKE